MRLKEPLFWGGANNLSKVRIFFINFENFGVNFDFGVLVTFMAY